MITQNIFRHNKHREDCFGCKSAEQAVIKSFHMFLEETKIPVEQINALCFFGA